MMAKTMIGQIELRSVDGFWVAGYRLPGHPEAVEIARILLTLVENSEPRRKAFQQFVMDAIGDLVRDAGGPPPTWNKTHQVMG